MDLWLKLVLVQAALLTIQGILYFGVQYFEGPPHDMKLPLDDHIPFRTQAIFIYVLWYPLIAFYPLALYAFSPEAYKVYMIAIVVDILISIFIFYVYPTSFERPKPTTDTLSGKTMALMHIANYTGKNCLPSMHCSMCFIILFSAGGCDQIPFGMLVGVVILTLGIVISTVLTKQHVIIDVVAAHPLALFCIWIAEKSIF